MTQIRIDAIDTLFFRDGKPFTGGEDVWADMMFPPSPSVVYGALRTAYFARHIDKLKKANQPQSDPTGALSLELLALQIDDALHFPLPLDCVVKKGRDEKKTKKKAFLLPRVLTVPVASAPPITSVLTPADGMAVEYPSQGPIVAQDVLEEYLSGEETQEIIYTELSKYLTMEPKIGLGLDRVTNTAREGMLYRLDMRRPASKMTFKKSSKPLALVAQFSGFYEQLPPGGLLRLGGEGKAAQYETVTLPPAAAPTLTGRRFKLYVATPAIFEHGWLPAWIDPKTLTGMFNNLTLRLETAVLGKPIAIGGFDQAAGRPKPMSQAVPAGSVYYFALTDESSSTIDDAGQLFHHQCISDDPSLCRQGFGLTFVGGVI